jgi:hypothetical protein
MSNAEYVKPSAVYSKASAVTVAAGALAVSCVLPPAYYKIGVSRILGIKWTSDATGCIPVAEPVTAPNYTYIKSITIAAASGAPADPTALVHVSGGNWTAAAYANIIWYNENPQTGLTGVVSV